MRLIRGVGSPSDHVRQEGNRLSHGAEGNPYPTVRPSQASYLSAGPALDSHSVRLEQCIVLSSLFEHESRHWIIAFMTHQSRSRQISGNENLLQILRRIKGAREGTAGATGGCVISIDLKHHGIIEPLPALEREDFQSKSSIGGGSGKSVLNGLSWTCRVDDPANPTFRLPVLGKQNAIGFDGPVEPVLIFDPDAIPNHVVLRSSFFRRASHWLPWAGCRRSGRASGLGFDWGLTGCDLAVCAVLRCLLSRGFDQQRERVGPLPRFGAGITAEGACTRRRPREDLESHPRRSHT